jgi:hypothetical protein
MQGRSHGYYRCPKCGTRVRDDALEAVVSESLLKSAGERELRRRVVMPGDDHAAEIRKTERDLEAMRGLSARSDTIRAAVAELETQLDDLRAAPHEPETVQWVKTGITVAQHWSGLDRDARGAFLREWDVVAMADREGVTVRLGWLEPDSGAFDVNA